MARRKNTKFIDPRYFMDEKVERLDEAQQDRGYGVAYDTPVTWALYGPDSGDATVQGLRGLDNIARILKMQQDKGELGPVQVKLYGEAARGPDGKQIPLRSIAVINEKGHIIFAIPAANREPPGGHRLPGAGGEGGKTVFTAPEGEAFAKELRQMLQTAG
jgi:hypothetical protein